MRDDFRNCLFGFIVFWLIGCGLPPAAAASGTGSRSPDLYAAQWDSLIRDKAFSYKDVKELAKPPGPASASNPFGKLLDSLARFFSGSTGKAILWTILFAVIGYILLKLFFGNAGFLFRRGRMPKKQAPPGSEEEEWQNTDWEQLLNIALNNGDRRAAVRCSYMLLLKLLERKGLIVFRHDKTNHDYYRELEETVYKQPFRVLSVRYEYAWYGNYPLSDKAFDDYMDTCNLLKKQLDS